MDRKLATVRMIDEIKPIEGSDAIEAARIGGWWIVVKKNEFAVNQFVVFCEIDSFIPTELAPFLTKPGHFPKEYNGVQGERLRTVKLRGCLSQGLILPLSVLAQEIVGDPTEYEGSDVSTLLGIVKWEPPVNANTSREAKGNFPHFLRKTDEERVQNLTREIEKRQWESFEVTTKLDGSSLTAYVFNEQEGVCSRNIELKEVEGNAFWEIARKYRLIEKLREWGRNLAIQGELIAPNIQKNYEKVAKPEFRCFRIFDIDAQEYLLPVQRRTLCKLLDIPHVPVLDDNFILNHSVQELLDMAEGDGMNQGVKREGLVYKSNTSQFSMKAISNSYLLKNG